MLGALMAFFTTPIYKRMLKRFKGKTGLSAALTTLALFLIIAIPVIIVITVAVSQALVLADNLGVGEINSENIENSSVEAVNQINSLIESTTGVSQPISVDSVTSFVKTTLPDLVGSLADSLLGVASSIPAFFMNLIIFIFVYVAFLTNSKKIIELLHELSPFDKEINDLYFNRIGIMANAMLKGQFLIAFLQGLATSIALALIGLGEYFSFFLLIFTFLSLIPLGAGVIIIPLGIILILIGDVWQGVLLLANHFIVVTNIDNIRPKLVPKEARMQSALTILAAFAGVSFWGLLGVIYGPIIMIMLVTTIETYVKVQKEYAQ
jgi:predicted PurR-regulated permease PerM